MHEAVTGYGRESLGALFMQATADDAQEHPMKYVAAAATISILDPAMAPFVRGIVRIGGGAMAVGEVIHENQ
jgi:hypothetical protein